jgi:chromosome segregation ATPase
MDRIELAKKFHETYEKLAPQFGYSTRDDTKSFDENSSNGRLMIEVCGTVLVDLFTALEEKEKKIKRLKDSAAIDLDVARDLIRERDQAELTMAKLRAQLVDAITDKEEFERNIEDWKTTAEIEAEGLEGWKDTAIKLQSQLATAREGLESISNWMAEPHSARYARTILKKIAQLALQEAYHE